MTEHGDGRQTYLFETIYDTYNASLYGMILKTCQNVNQAEDILVQAFKTFFHQNMVPGNNKPTFIALLKVTIEIVSEKTLIPKASIAKLIFKEVDQVKTMRLTY